MVGSIFKLTILCVKFRLRPGGADEVTASGGRAADIPSTRTPAAVGVNLKAEDEDCNREATTIKVESCRLQRNGGMHPL